MNDAFMKAFKDRGHEFIMKEGNVIDVFVVNTGFHNGPGCRKCDYRACYHCSGPEDIPECPRKE